MVAEDVDGHVPFSIIGRVRVNKRLRKCKICKVKLSMYNVNEYCFAHLHIGLEQEAIAQDEKRIKQWKAKSKRLSQQRIMESLGKPMKKRKKKVKRPSGSKTKRY